MSGKENTESKTFGERVLEFAYEAASVFSTAVVIIALVFTFGMRFVSVVGGSMEPTLHSMDWVFVTQSEYEPAYGDIVVISQPNSYGQNIIKRVIAVGGQSVDINFSTGQVFVDGQEIYEPYINNATTNHYDMTFPVTVPEGHVFVLGDNRQGSIDSRSSTIGFIRNDYLLGRADTALTEVGFEDLSLK